MEERGEDGNGEEGWEGRGGKVGGGEGKERGGRDRGRGGRALEGNRDTVLAVSHAVTRIIFRRKFSNCSTPTVFICNTPMAELKV